MNRIAGFVMCVCLCMFVFVAIIGAVTAAPTAQEYEDAFVAIKEVLEIVTDHILG